MFGSTLFGFAPSLPAGGGANGVDRTAPRDKRFGPSFGGRKRDALARRSGGVGGWLRAAWRRHLSRNCLARMDGYLLKDIGLSQADAEAEMNKPFWME